MSMTLGRREFLGGVAAAGLLAGCRYTSTPGNEAAAPGDLAKQLQGMAGQMLAEYPENATILGIATGAYEEAVRYASVRKQFGQTIASFQGIAFQLADLATEIEAGRHLTYHAAWLAQQGKPFSKQAAMAKLFCSELAMRATIKAVQVHGGYGYTKDYPVERMMRDAKICEIGEGTSEIQRIVISRHILRELAE